MPPTIKRSKLALWILAALVLGSAFVGRHRAARFIAERNGPTSEAAAQAGTSTHDLANGWQQGEMRRYRARLATEVTAPDGATMYQLSVEGTWQLTAVVASTQGVELHGALSNVAVKTAGKGADQAQLAELARDLETPVLFTLDPRGSVRELSMDADKPKLVAGLLKSIVAYAQFTQPLAAEAHWTAEEIDGSGKYTADYRIDAADPRSVHKHKLRYTALIASDPNATGSTRIDVAKSDARYTLDKRLLRSFALHEELMTKGGLIPDLRSSTDLSLDFVASERIAQPRLVALRRALSGSAPLPLYATAPLAGPSKDLDRVRVAGRSFEDLMQAFANIPRPPKPADPEEPPAELPVPERQKFDALFSAMSALFRLDDDSVTEAVAQIRAGSPDAAMLRDALWNAGTSYAQESLVKLMSFYKDERDKRFTLIGLGQVKQPTKATVVYMESMFDDAMHGRQARLSYGSAAQYLKESDPPAANAIVNKLTARYSQATDPVIKASFVDALGNTRQDSALPAIKTALQSEESLVRASGVLALRHLEGDAIDAMIQQVAVSDPVALVRNTAIGVIGERTPTAPLMQALDMLMRSDPEIMVRRSALIAGVNLKDVVPELRNTVAWVASNDPEPKMRELASDYL